MDYKTLLREDGSSGLTLTGGRLAKGGVIARARRSRPANRRGRRSLQLFIPRARLPVEDGRIHAPTGGRMTVVSAEGVCWAVRSVRDFGAGDLLEIAPPAGESWWLPFTKAAVPEVRIDERTIMALRPDETE